MIGQVRRAAANQFVVCNCQFNFFNAQRPSTSFDSPRGSGNAVLLHPPFGRSCSLSRPRFSGFQHLSTSPETKFRGRWSDAVQAYVREGGEHEKRRALPSPEFSLNARIPTLPNCVQEGDFNLASTALKNCTTSWEGRPASVRGGLRAGFDADPSPRFTRPSQWEGDDRCLAMQGIHRAESMGDIGAGWVQLAARLAFSPHGELV
jgi:hypothetical protein